MATVKIPPVLRPAVGGEKELSADGSSVGEILRSVADSHPETQSQLFAADGGCYAGCGDGHTLQLLAAAKASGPIYLAALAATLAGRALPLSKWHSSH